MTPELVAAAERFDKAEKHGTQTVYEDGGWPDADTDAYVLAREFVQFIDIRPLSSLSDDEWEALKAIGGGAYWQIDLPQSRSIVFTIGGVGKFSLFLKHRLHNEPAIWLLDNPTVGQLYHLIAALGGVK